MSIAHLFESGEMKEHKGAFRNLIMMAKSDGDLSPEEENLLTKMAKKLDLSEEDVEQIRSNPDAYPIHPPHDKEDRHRRLISMIVMAVVDHEIDQEELTILNRLAIGLGYKEQQAAELTNRILHGLRIGMSEDEILDGLMESR
jgi:uncharacterized tellurite resistance protein B-like protein